MSGSLTLSDVVVTSAGELGVEDIRLAEALGMERPRDIRKLIERHREALERLGPICATVAQDTDIKGRGRPGRTFWLNKRQALYLCTKSETPRSTDATIQMVEVFDAHLARSLPAPDPAIVDLSQVLEHEMPAGDFALMRIGRRTVMLDIKRYRPGPEDEAVVIRHDGRIVITRVQDGGAPDAFGARGAAARWRRPPKGHHRGALAVSDVVQVLGIVVKPALTARTGGRASAGASTTSLTAPPRRPRRGAASVPLAAMMADRTAPATLH